MRQIFYRELLLIHPLIIDEILILHSQAITCMLEHGQDLVPYLQHFNFFDYILTLLSSPQGLSISCQAKCLRIICLFLLSDELAMILAKDSVCDVNYMLKVMDGYCTSSQVQVMRLQKNAEIILDMIVERFNKIEIAKEMEEERSAFQFHI